MASLSIVKFGNEALRVKARPVAAVTDDIRRLAADMLKAMHAHDGLGLAAEQIGRSEAICVIDVPPVREDPAEAEGAPASDSAAASAPVAPMPLVMVNPRTAEESGQETAKEGCLSFPEIFVKIKRARRVKAEYVDLDNRPQTLEADGLLARAIQHELDHLNGVLLVDRMSAVQRMGVAGKLKKLRLENAAGSAR